MTVRTGLLFLAAVCILVHVDALALQTTARKWVKAQAPLVHLLTAKIDRGQPGWKTRGTYSITGTSRLGVQFVRFTEVDASDSTVDASVTIDECPREVALTLLVKVKDKIFVPDSYGGNGNRISLLHLRGVDRASADILNGGPLPAAPKDSIRVEMQQARPASLAGQVPVFITVANVASVPLTIYWDTNGGSSSHCRERQLSFEATRYGVPVPANPKPLPDGFISPPFDAKPNSPLKRTEDLKEWLQIQKPGRYLVKATYEIVIENPQKDATPRAWTIKYHNQFPVDVTP